MRVFDEQWARFWEMVRPEKPAEGQQDELRAMFLAGWFFSLSRLTVPREEGSTTMEQNMMVMLEENKRMGQGRKKLVECKLR